MAIFVACWAYLGAYLLMMINNVLIDNIDSLMILLMIIHSVFLAEDCSSHLFLRVFGFVFTELGVVCSKGPKIGLSSERTCWESISEKLSLTKPI